MGPKSVIWELEHDGGCTVLYKYKTYLLSAYYGSKNY